MQLTHKSSTFAKAGRHTAGCPCCSGRVAAVKPVPVARKATVAVRAQAAATTTTVAPPTTSVNGNTNAGGWPTMMERHRAIVQHFPTAVGVDDLIGRVELALASFGFTGDNTIAMTNLCRDEVTAVLKDKIDSVFGASFNTNGLGGVLTCGVTGMKAGLSHSPVCNGGRERYVFFSFPHIAINSKGEIGAITRPGRPKQSCACGALLKCLGELKSEGVEASCKVPGVHDPLEPEYSILKQRLARRARYERVEVAKLDLPSLTSLAERTITGDLEYLIDKAVDPKISDYAVITGVQIHNWADDLVPGGEHSLEFVAPTKAYVVVNGQKTYVDLGQVPSLSPRQLQLAARKSLNGAQPEAVEPGLYGSVMSDVPLDYLVNKLGGAVNAQYGAPQLSYSVSEINPARPTWATKTMSEFAPKNMPHLDRDPNAPQMDTLEPVVKVNPSFEAPNKN